MSKNDVRLLGGITQSRGDLAAKAKPDEPLHELVDPQQQRQRADDQFAPPPDSAQRLDPNPGDHHTRGEVGLR